MSIINGGPDKIGTFLFHTRAVIVYFLSCVYKFLKWFITIKTMLYNKHFQLNIKQRRWKHKAISYNNSVGNVLYPLCVPLFMVLKTIHNSRSIRKDQSQMNLSCVRCMCAECGSLLFNNVFNESIQTVMF